MMSPARQVPPPAGRYKAFLPPPRCPSKGGDRALIHIGHMAGRRRIQNQIRHAVFHDIQHLCHQVALKFRRWLLPGPDRPATSYFSRKARMQSIRAFRS